MSPQEHIVEVCKRLPTIHPWNVEDVIEGIEKQGINLREEQKQEIIKSAIDKIRNWAIAA